MAITYETMYQELDGFGVGYDFPVYCTMSDRSGFLSSGRFNEWGFLAADISGEALLLTKHGLMETLAGTHRYESHTIYRMSVEKLKISKALLVPTYTISIKWLEEGKKKDMKIMVASVTGKGFPEQKNSAPGLINLLKNWEASL